MARLTRRTFLATVTAPLLIPGTARADEDDQAVLNFALLLEDLQVTLYREALELDLGFDLAGLLRTFADHENEHVERLRALGGGSAEPLRFAYGLETRDEVLQLAPTVEDTVVGAYIGAIPAATTPKVRSLLAGIVHTEAQQASTLRMLASEAAAPAAFDEVLSRTVLLDRVRPFIAT
ncbi:ferritin-like domain-containing protein [Solirubrobacter taibaiensis]|nr:ferritin-like domain-containing protein [Solirubrobacter taibaiensis]